VCEYFGNDFIQGGAPKYRPIFLDRGRVLCFRNKSDNSLVHMTIHVICLENM